MRIGYVVSRYPAVSHTFILREVLGLRRLGWEVMTVSVRAAAARDLLTEADRAEATGTRVLVPRGPLAMFRVVTAGVATLVGSPARFFRAWKTAWRLRRPGMKGTLWAFFYFLEALILHRLCVRQHLRHLHAHFANVASDVSMIASVLNAGTFSFTMHGPTEFFDIPGHRLAEKALAATAVICISDFARSQVMALLPPAEWNKLHVVHCGVDPAQFAAPRPARVAGAPIELLCVARLAPVKGHAILLHALHDLVQRGMDARLTLAGDGPVRGDLEHMAEELHMGDRVRFLGNVGQDEIHQLYAMADVFVLPSFAEGVPVVLMEAMASGCPVVATRIAGIPELIERGVTGMMVTPGRPDLLADGIAGLLTNRAAAERMVEGAREKIRLEFNIFRVAPQLSDIFRSLLEPATQRPALASPAPPMPRAAAPAVVGGGEGRSS
ncbi:MAG TPA: glycosyltransferase family 4 protein [Phycisphaerae bacterium]|nr:glycosyltransferase family 4 protein [Phycisphaerae bacterium]